MPYELSNIINELKDDLIIEWIIQKHNFDII